MHHSSSTGFPFNLRVVEARGLASTKRDIADPFVVVKLKGLKHIFNSEKQSTEVQMNRENPVFNQDFLLHPKDNDTILVKVMDKNTPINRKLGKVLIPVSSLLNKSTIDSWFPIEGKSGRSGEIRLLINYGSQKFSGFKDYLATKNTSTLPGKTVAPLPSALSKNTEGTTLTKETKTTKFVDDASSKPILPPSQTAPLASTRPVLPPSQTVPLATSKAPIAPVALQKPVSSGMGNPSSLLEPIKNLHVSRETVVQERIHPVEEEIVQPVIHRERQQTEIHRVQEDINESKVLPTVYEDRTLPAEYRNFEQTRDFLKEEYGSNATITSSVDIDQVQHIRVVKEPIIEETIKKTVLQVVQPVIHRETVAKSVVRETLPIYEKVIEQPLVVNEAVNLETMNFGVLPVVPQMMPSMVKETVVSTQTVEPVLGAKVPLASETRLNQPYQSY